MKVYFSASTVYKSQFEVVYQKIVDYLQHQGHEVFEVVLSEHLPSVSGISAHSVKQWFREWSAYVRECDFAVIEGSYPSTIQIGFEVGMILARGKSVVLIFQEGKDPVFINQLYSSRLIRSAYTESNVIEVISWCLEEVKESIDRRFTFFISPTIDEYLSEMMKKEGISRSSYIRQLIEKEMEKKRSNKRS